MNARSACTSSGEAYERRGNELSVLNRIGTQLSAERDIDTLLALILQKSREITGADAGSLYMVERATDNGDVGVDQLRFKLAQNDTMPLPFQERAMPLDKSSIAGSVAVTGQKQNLRGCVSSARGDVLPASAAPSTKCRGTARSRCW